ncbi:MAG: efflux transporter outer membrane subunit [Rhodospirillaceae bacterium]|nr:efflux transporter outer membrane subunit [Rhodospirillales bacterium]
MRPLIPFLAVALAGCSQIPDLTVPSMDFPASYANTEASQLTAPQAWWGLFGSPELDALEQAALAANHDFKAAVARIEQAEATLRIAGSPLLPNVTATGTGSSAMSHSSTTSTRTGATVKRSYQGSVAASYEVDFWGKNAASVQSAEASLAASRFDRDVVALTLTANVASTYFQALALGDRVAVARRNLDIARQTLELAEKLAGFGQTSELEAAQQRSNVALIEAQLPALELQRVQVVDALAILTGLPPSKLALNGTTLAGLPAPVVQAGLPSDLLRRRPDIARAEANLAAANANIGIARAQLFPTVSLTAEGGLLNPYLISLADAHNTFWSLGTSIAGTLFDNGKLRGNVDLSEAKLRESAETYQGVVLTALKEVEDSLAGTHWLAQQEDAQNRAVTFAREAQRLSDVRYREGAVEYLTVLESQRTLLQAEDGAVQVRLARLTASVNLVKALGGGM